MALTLVGDLNTTNQTFLVTGTPAPTGGDFLQVGDEQMLVTGAGLENTRYRVEAIRGFNSTDPAVHANGATAYRVTAVVQTDAPTSPPAASGGGGGGSVSVTDGTTTVAAATSIQVASVSDGGSGVAAIASVVVGDDDPGAIGAHNVWVQTNVGGNDDYTQIWVRNEADDAWLVIGPVVNSNGTTYVLLASPGDVAELNLADGAGSYLTANTNLALRAGAAAFFLDNATGIHIGSTVGGPALLAGNVDPRGGAGVAAPMGSSYRDTATGTSYDKTGAGDTAWRLVVTGDGATPADIADPASATAEDVATKVNELLGILRGVGI